MHVAFSVFFSTTFGDVFVRKPTFRIASMRAPFATAFVYKRSKKSLSAAINYGTWPKDYPSHISTASLFNRSESDDFRSSVIFLQKYKNKHANRHMTTRRLRKKIRRRLFICALRVFLHLSPARSEKVGTTRESNVKFAIFNKRLWGHPRSDVLLATNTSFFLNRFSLATPRCQLCLRRAITIGQYLKFP